MLTKKGSNIEGRLIQFRKHGGDLGGPGRSGRLCLDSRRQQGDLGAKGQTLASQGQVEMPNVVGL